MYSYSDQLTWKPGLMDFHAEHQKVCHSRLPVAKLVQKEAQNNM